MLGIVRKNGMFHSRFIFSADQPQRFDLFQGALQLKLQSKAFLLKPEFKNFAQDGGFVFRKIIYTPFLYLYLGLRAIAQSFSVYQGSRCKLTYLSGNINIRFLGISLQVGAEQRSKGKCIEPIPLKRILASQLGRL